MQTYIDPEGPVLSIVRFQYFECISIDKEI